MKETIIKTEKLCKTFSTGGIQQHVLRNIDLEIYKGDFTVIMGSSGSGKSTLLYALSGMDAPTQGSVMLAGEEISGKDNDSLALIRRKSCGFVFQSIYLLENMNMLDNIMAGGLLVSKDKKAVYEKSVSLLKKLGLSDEDFRKFPNQLSGGEKQRAAIVRAIINEPQILFADEPTGALNSASGAQVMEQLETLNAEGQSIVMVTHDMKVALRGNRVLYLKDGSVCGEEELGSYKQAKDAGKLGERQAKLSKFLANMGW